LKIQHFFKVMSMAIGSVMHQTKPDMRQCQIKIDAVLKAEFEARR